MKISIITPCFNSEKTIERTIQSVVNQKTEYDIEYIIIDGKSADCTCDIIKDYAERYPCIKWISEKDNSMTEALNKGMKRATGKIIASLNADDMYLPGIIQKIGDIFATDDKMKVCMVNNYFADADTKRILSKNKPRFFAPMICGFIECPFPECGIFYSNECLQRVGYFNEEIKYTQDLEFYLRLISAGYKFRYRNVDASIFFRSSENYSSVVSDQMDLEVCSYFKYKKLYSIFSHSFISKVLKIILGIRKYYFRNMTLEEVLKKCKD